MWSLERSGATVALLGPEGRYSLYDPHRLFTGMGWDAEAASALLAASPRRLLLLGFGGGTVARQLRAMYPHAAITGVEIDRDVIDVGRTHFAIDAIGASIVACDGESFIRSGRDRYDVVIDDMWDHEQRVERAILRDPSWLRHIRLRLTKNGVYAINLYSRRKDAARYDAALRAMRSAFARVVEAHVPGEAVTVLAGGTHASAAEAIERRRTVAAVPPRVLFRDLESEPRC